MTVARSGETESQPKISLLVVASALQNGRNPTGALAHVTETAEQKRQRQELGKRLTIALITPLLLLIGVAVVLGAQILRMTNDSHWLDHSDEVIARTNAITKQILDQETGLRGYLVTGDPLFLQHYRLASPIEKIDQLEQFLSDNPSQVARVEDVRNRYYAWLSSEGDVDHHPLAELQSRESMLRGKNAMDNVRDAIGRLTEAELDIRSERAAQAESSRNTTRLLFFGLFGLTALVLTTLSRQMIGSITKSYGDALTTEREARAAIEDRDWIGAGTAKVAEQLLGELTLEELGERALQTLTPYVQAEVAAFYSNDETEWKKRASYGAVTAKESIPQRDSLLARAAKDRKIVQIDDVPKGYLNIASGLGDHDPAAIVIIPAEVDGHVFGIVELGFLTEMKPRVHELLRRVSEGVAISIRTTRDRMRLRELLEESQRQGEELQTQQEELRVANEELEERSTALREAHAQVETRQEELEVTNQRLSEQARQLRIAQEKTLEKAAEVERASQYKSEFLANMSHELRTPLNSSLILSKLLADNKDGNLTEEQVKFANTIYAAGNDLLSLINDVLDLSKVEAGKLDLNAGATPIARLTGALARTFDPIARERGLALKFVVDPQAPEVIETDALRLEQILKNLLSNALKFTDSGEVVLSVSPCSGNRICFAVKDSGIGIPSDHLASIFEAFRQVDATIQRKYGGTGLGLSISRDFAKLLGGDLQVESVLGKGSTFTLTLPIVFVEKAEPVVAPPPQNRRARSVAPPAETPSPPTPSGAHPPQFSDDRTAIDRTRRLLLVVEDDVSFAQILYDLSHERSFQCIVAHEANEGFNLALKHLPDAIVLDVALPDHTGLSVLDRLKRDPRTRHIPVHMVSASDHTETALSMGALGYLIKPVQRETLVAAFQKLEERFTKNVRRLLIVEDDAVQRDSLTHLLKGDDVEIFAVGSVSEALGALAKNTFDCVVTDLTLPDASGFDLLEKMGNGDAYAFPPVIIYTGRSLSTAEEQQLRKYSSSIIVKGARSPERLLDEVTLFLHQVESELPADRRRMLKQARDREVLFDGRNILVVEDDVRNIFALSSILEPKGAKIVIARNGLEALEVLETTPNVDLVLMDVMMPEMDGIQATREIRKQSKWARLPIIALTAKAMRDDQERCLAAGANDYVSKPVDVEMLMSLLRVWMPKSRTGA
jgi:CheY-like chemotaxis protein/CHASE3 domain sensor protein